MKTDRTRPQTLREIELEVEAEGREWTRQRLQQRLQEEADRHGEVFPPCMLISIFLVWREPNRKMGPPRPPAGGRRTSAPLATNTFISSDTLSFFTLNGVQASDASNYRLVIKSASSPSIGVASAQFTLTVLADSDGDRLPDVWETAYPTATDPALDSDNDGLTNLEEYQAGTDPTNAASVLRINLITGGNSATIEFEALSNKTYTVQYKDRVSGGSWSKLIDIVARATNRTETVTDSGAGTNRYYRLVTSRQP